MGIKDLYSFLEKTFPGLSVVVKIEAMRGITLCFDLSLYLYKFKALSTDDRGIVDAFFFMIHGFRKAGISLIAVKDGQAVPEKLATQNERKSRKTSSHDKIDALRRALTLIRKRDDTSEIVDALNAGGIASKATTVMALPSTSEILERIGMLETQTLSITDEERQHVDDIMLAMGVPIVQAPREAEQLCAQLVKARVVNGCLSDDSDLLACGCPFIFRKYEARTHNISVLALNDVLATCGMTYEQFLDFCVLCGNDYNPRIPKVGVKASYALVKKYGSIEAIPDDVHVPRCNIKGFQSKADTILNYHRTREIFLESDPIPDLPRNDPVDSKRVKTVLINSKSNIPDAVVYRLLNSVTTTE